jgi:photosystem II stability/assembly factor-like uncharacterized protein
VLLAALADGIYRTADGGSSWTRVHTPTSGDQFGVVTTSVAFDPNNGLNAIAAGVNGQVAYSRDGGVTWTEHVIVAPGAFFLRVEPAYARTVPNLLYASVDCVSLPGCELGGGRVYRSTDGGASWTQLSQPLHLGGQGLYANAIWVDPTNAQNLVVGGYALWRSTDGGATFTNISGTLDGAGFGVHPDQHVIVSQPGFDSANGAQRVVYAGNDGGLYRSSDILSADSTGATWSRLNNGLQVSQFYSGAGSNGRITGGTQDVGTLTYMPEYGRWRTFSGGTYMQASNPRSFSQDPDRTFSGDSGGVAIDPGDNLNMYFASLYLGVSRSTDGGDTINMICAGLSDATCGIASARANFASPILLDPVKGSRLYAGAASLWVTDDATAATPAWRNIKAALPTTISLTNNVNAIAVAPTDPNVAWVGYNDGTLAVTQDALDAAPRWRQITAPLPTNRPVTSILVSSTDSQTAYVTWGNDGFIDTGYATGNLQRTQDLGRTWVNVASALPNVPMQSIVQRPGNPLELYLGTALGMYSSADGGNTWSTVNIGPANTIFTQLFWLDGSTLAAATYGRSMFSKALAPAGTAATTTTLAVAPNPSASGSSAALSASIVAASGTPTGTVSFTSDADVIPGCQEVRLGNPAVSDASCTTNVLPPGTHSIVARYSGDNQFAPSVSAPFVLTVTPVAAPVLTASPATLDFGLQSMHTTSQTLTVTVSNPTASPVLVQPPQVPEGFSVVSNDCGTLAAAGSCQVAVAFTGNTSTGYRLGRFGGLLSLGASPGPVLVGLEAVVERSLVNHYYLSILRRLPDDAGKAFWESEASRVASLGADVNEAWYAMAMSFYTSAEYAAFGRDDPGYVTDLYNTFFNRLPEAAGSSYWAGQLAAGMPREVLLAQFMFSAEFTGFAQEIFGNTAARAEVNTAIDFYRGLLARLPDSAGFTYWVGQFRAAQCQSSTAIYSQVEAISSAFTTSAEYANRHRSNAQYVGDLYNAFLRRGGDLAGVQFWIGQLASGAQTRETVRRAFLASPEFSQRVAAVVAQGCLR